MGATTVPKCAPERGVHRKGAVFAQVRVAEAWVCRRSGWSGIGPLSVALIGARQSVAQQGAR